MQSVSSRIWTRVSMSISYDDNHYTTGTSLALFIAIPFSKKSIVKSPFMSQKIISMIFSTNCCTRNFFFTGELVCFYLDFSVIFA